MSFRLMCAIWSLESSSSASGSVGPSRLRRSANSKVWHISIRSTRTSTGRPRASVDEVQLLVAVQRVVLAVRPVAAGLHELAERLPVPAPRREVDVPPLALDPCRPLRAPSMEGEAAEEPDLESCGLRQADQADRLGERVTLRRRPRRRPGSGPAEPDRPAARGRLR